MGMVVAYVFQNKLDEIFHNVPGVTGIADDMVIYGKSIEKHHKHFLNFLSIVRKNNLKLNALKLQFQLKEESFFGHNWSSKENITRSKKVQAIIFIFILYYKPEMEHYQSFNTTKKKLSTKIVLPYYDPASHTTLQTDSSKKGLRAVLIQNGTPIYFASRASPLQNPTIRTLNVRH